AAASMETPPLVDRPQMLLRQHLLNAFDRRYRRTRAGFGIKAVAAAASTLIARLRMVRRQRIFHPVGGRNVFVRPAHFYSAVATDGGGLSSGRRNYWIRPQQVFFNLQICLFNVRRGRIVAAV